MARFHNFDIYTKPKYSVDKDCVNYAFIFECAFRNISQGAISSATQNTAICSETKKTSNHRTWNKITFTKRICFQIKQSQASYKPSTDTINQLFN